MGKISLILGGAASGKSQYAEDLAKSYGSRFYIATAISTDAEFERRIQNHKDRRGKEWQTLEVPLDLAGVLASLKDPQSVILIDCMTLWLTNLVLGEKQLEAETNTIIQALKTAKPDIIMVSNEVGHGIVPENALARHFRDAQGTLNQALAKAASNVVFVIAGCPMILKGD